MTDDGRPVARIVPIDQPSALERLVAEGRVRPARRKKGPLAAPIETSGPVSDLVTDQRR